MLYLSSWQLRDIKIYKNNFAPLWAGYAFLPCLRFFPKIIKKRRKCTHTHANAWHLYPDSLWWADNSRANTSSLNTPFTAINTWAVFVLCTQSKHFLTNTPRPLWTDTPVTTDTQSRHQGYGPVFLRQDPLSGGPLVPRGPTAADESAEDKEGCRKEERKNGVCEGAANGALLLYKWHIILSPLTVAGIYGGQKLIESEMSTKKIQQWLLKGS